MTRLVRWRRRSRRELLSAAVVWGGVVGFVVATYVVVVLGGGALIGRTSSPHVGLSVLATAVVAVGFDPLVSRLQAWSARTVLGGRATPYDVLRRFSAAVAGSAPAEELPERMARVLADGTGATSAEVWVVVGDREVLAATWPPSRTGADEAPRPRDGARTLPVRHGDELLGELVVVERPGASMTAVEERLFAELAGQAGLVLRGARLRAELEARLAELSARAEELRRSRERLVDAQDAERRRLERDIHDGAQQHLVALAVNLRLADTLARSAPERADALLAAQEEAAVEAVATLARLSRGIYPPVLEERGVVAALRAATEGSAVPVEVVEHQVGRYPVGVEAAAYFACLEALQNAAKHAGAGTVRVELHGGRGVLELEVADDGRGFDPESTPVGVGLSNLRGRVESVGGRLHVDSAPGRGTRIRAALPVPLLATARGGG
jgi:signal transduction histidine kinase